MLLLGVQDQREILFKPQMKKQGRLPLMSGCLGVIGGLAFAADAICPLLMLSLGNCFSHPNTASIFYLSVKFHLAK